jgi:hypothetical protein
LPTRTNLGQSRKSNDRIRSGPEEKEDCFGTFVVWVVYGANNERDRDLLAATALRCHSDELLEKWGRDPLAESFLKLVQQSRELVEAP